MLPATKPEFRQKPHVNRLSDEFQQLISRHTPQEAKLSERQLGQPLYSGPTLNPPPSCATSSAEFACIVAASVASVRYQQPPDSSKWAIIVVSD
jgi:hypothetical protein